jgi:hypothetical protein
MEGGRAVQLFFVSPPHAENQVSAASSDGDLKLGSGSGMERVEKKILNITAFLECPVGQGSKTSTSGRNILTAEYTLTLDDVSLTRQVLTVVFEIFVLNLLLCIQHFDISLKVECPASMSGVRCLVGSVPNRRTDTPPRCRAILICSRGR